jgi:hypothetical protein
MKEFAFVRGTLNLRESYEKTNCICLDFHRGYMRIDYNGLEVGGFDKTDDLGTVDGIDMFEGVM